MYVNISFRCYNLCIICNGIHTLKLYVIFAKSLFQHICVMTNIFFIINRNFWQYLCLFPKYPDIWRYIRSMKNIYVPKKLMLMLFKETSRLIKEQTWHISSLVNKITWPCRDVWYTKMLIFCSQINIINVPCHCSIMKCIIKFISSFLYLWIQNLFLLIND